MVPSFTTPGAIRDTKPPSAAVMIPLLTMEAKVWFGSWAKVYLPARKSESVISRVEPTNPAVLILPVAPHKKSVRVDYKYPAVGRKETVDIRRGPHR